jgi:hypothetical protein
VAILAAAGLIVGPWFVDKALPVQFTCSLDFMAA